MTTAAERRLSRRQLLSRSLRLAVALPAGAILAACGRGEDDDEAPVATAAGTSTSVRRPTPTATPLPPIIAAGVERRLLPAGGDYETPLYVFGSGRPGAVLMVLGGVHGDEPGGWQAAEALVAAAPRPASGGLIVVPRANRLATESFVRTTEALGDLNRLYPGDPRGLPMARMAFAIVETMRELGVTTLVDMHESWAFYRDRPQSGTAFLGQTVSSSTEPGISLGRDVVAAVNGRIQAAHEELFFRERQSRSPTPPASGPVNAGDDDGGATRSGRSRSSLGLPTHLPGVVALLVEMGQQQGLERRVALHLDVVAEVGRRIGTLA